PAVEGGGGPVAGPRLGQAARPGEEAGRVRGRAGGDRPPDPAAARRRPGAERQEQNAVAGGGAEGAAPAGGGGRPGRGRGLVRLPARAGGGGRGAAQRPAAAEHGGLVAGALRKAAPAGVHAGAGRLKLGAWGRSGEPSRTKSAARLAAPTPPSELEGAAG